MSFDLTPFGAPAPETRAQPSAAPGEGRTLTLPLRRPALAAGGAPMAGRLTLGAAEPAAPDTLHAGVVAAEGAALTLTLQRIE